MNNSIDRNASSAVAITEIDVVKLQRNDIGELLKLAYQLDKKALVDSFARAGVKVQNYNDLALMARLHDKGEDERGVFLDEFGKSIKFSVLDILHRTKSDFESNFKQKKLNLKWK
jgi:hypothetical protein